MTEKLFSMFFEKVRASARKIDIDGPELPRKRKVLSRYEEGEAPADLHLQFRSISTKFFIKKMNW